MNNAKEWIAIDGKGLYPRYHGKCPYCGKKGNTKWVVCPYCGTKVSPKDRPVRERSYRIYVEETRTWYDSIKECSKSIHISHSYICQAVRSGKNTACGFHFSVEH